jgi:predicted SAM-dependent methyltransferase
MTFNVKNCFYRIFSSFWVQRPLLAIMRLSGRERRMRNRYIAAHPKRLLQLGAGQNFKQGWLNTNWFPIDPRQNRSIFLDATHRFPLPSESFDAVFSEHMIEHLPPEGATNMLQETYRVLKPGGVMRISTPNLAFLIALLSENPSELEKAYLEWNAATYLRLGWPRTAAAVFNNYVRDWGHLFIYDHETLRKSISNAGFSDIREQKLGESEHPELCGMEFAERMPDGFLALESMIFEARKPA